MRRSTQCENVRKSENKVSHELKIKEDKVSALRREEKKNEWREERNGEKRRVCRKSREKP
jgi:hypothetical protein